MMQLYTKSRERKKERNVSFLFSYAKYYVTRIYLFIFILIFRQN